MTVTHLIIGIGEVGTAIWANLDKAGYKTTPFGLGEELEGQFDILHICFPPSETFVQDVKDYQKRFQAKHTIVYSSTPVGTVKQIPNAVHSPVEGVHPRLSYSVKMFVRWIGYNDIETANMAKAIWRRITEVKLVENSDFTELLKLASTSKYGLNIVWAGYMGEVAKHMKMDYQLIKDWDTDYNKLYSKLKLSKYRKFVLDPPEGEIGGHCIVPNAEILDEQFPNDILKMIKEQGK